LSNNRQLNVETTQPASSQVESALQQANQVILTADVPLEWPIGQRVSFFVTPGYGINWTQFDPFTLPSIFVKSVVGSTTVTTKTDAADYFDEDAVLVTRQTLDRVFPLSEFNVSAVFAIKRKTAPLFYFGGGVNATEQLKRTVAFDTADDTLANPIATSLTGKIDTPMGYGWRATAGFTLAGVVDIRVDAVGPIGGRERDALLRIVIARSFPVVGQ